MVLILSIYQKLKYHVLSELTFFNINISIYFFLDSAKKKLKKLKLKRNNRVEPLGPQEAETKSPATPPPQLPGK